MLLAAWHAATAQQASEQPVSPVAISKYQRPGAVSPATSLLPALPGADPTKPGQAPLPKAIEPANLPPLQLPTDGEEPPAFPDLPEMDDISVKTVAQNPAAPPADGSAGTDPSASLPPLTLTWHSSPRKGRELAMEQGKCMLLVLTGLGGDAGARSQALDAEVLRQEEFTTFAAQNLILSTLNFVPLSPLDQNNPAAIARLEARESLKRSLNVRGYPAIILFGPDGRETRRWKGYVPGRPWHFFQDVKNSTLGAIAGHAESLKRRDQLVADGFRQWTSAQGSQLFAKFDGFDPETNRARLADEKQKRIIVSLEQLSLADREIVRRSAKVATPSTDLTR